MAQAAKKTKRQSDEENLYIGGGFLVLIIIAIILAIRFPVLTSKTIKESAIIVEDAVIVDKQTYVVGNGRTSLPAPLLICNLDGQKNIPVYVYWNWYGLSGSAAHLSDAAAWFNTKRVGDQIDVVYKIPVWKQGKPTDQFQYYIFIKGIEEDSIW